MIATALTIYAIAAVPLFALAMCFFIAGARADERDGKCHAAAGRDALLNLHEDADT